MAQLPSFHQAAKKEMDEYHFVTDLRMQPKWDIPKEIVIKVAVSGRAAPTNSTGSELVTDLDDFLSASGKLIEAGASGIHLDFSWVTDRQGRRLDRDVVPVDAYRTVLEPLRERYGRSFVADCNILNGETFEDNLAPARLGLAEVSPCAAGHPENWMTPAVEALESCGVKPEIVIHSPGEIELAKRKLIDTGILQKPYYFIILFGLPFNCGRTLISGTYIPNFQDMAQQMVLMVNQIRAIDSSSVIIVCAAGRATYYMTTLATMLGAHVRVGTEDTIWKYPNSDEAVASNLEMFSTAKRIAELHGRKVATAEQYRQIIGLV